MEVSESMGRIIMEGGNAMQIAEQAVSEGVLDLRGAGLNKVKEARKDLPAWRKSIGLQLNSLDPLYHRERRWQMQQ
jgi:hypothetical protein